MTTRRIVTGNDGNGKSYFVHDGPTPGHADLGTATVDELWVDDPAQPDPEAKRDPATSQTFHLEPPDGGSVVRVLTLQPQDSASSAEPGSSAAAGSFDTGGVMEKDEPGMHTTRTIDYGIVLSGEVDLALDSGELHMAAGDVVVQRATRHAWYNRGNQPCTIAFVLIASPNYR